MSDREIISRADAKAIGLKRYYVGPCKRGHDAERLVGNRNCVECYAELQRQYHIANAEKLREQKRQYQAANAEKLREQKRQYQAANAEKLREYAREYYRANAEKVREKVRQYREAYPEKVREQDSRYKKANPEKIREQKRRYYTTNLERCREQARRYHSVHAERRCAYVSQYREANLEKLRQYRENNRHKYVARQRLREARKLQATPGWFDKDAVEAVYKEAARLSVATGIEHHVDHIIPLRGKNVCGLHVQNNLMAVPRDWNASKGSKLIEDYDAWLLSQMLRVA